MNEFRATAATNRVHLSHRERSDRLGDPGEGVQPDVRPYPLSPWEREHAAAVETFAMSTPQISSISARDDLRTEPRFIRGVIIAMAVIFLTVFVVLPLVVVFAQAFSKGVAAYFAALSDPEALSAIRLTLCVAAISVSLNLVFGLVAAWAIAKFDFRGKTFLISLIDLPFSVSPVISGLVFVLLFGAQGYWGPGCRPIISMCCLRCRALH